MLKATMMTLALLGFGVAAGGTSPNIHGETPAETAERTGLRLSRVAAGAQRLELDAAAMPEPLP